MKRFDAWPEPYNPRPKVRVTGPAGAYWLVRRRDLLDGAASCPDIIARGRGIIWELAVDVLADATGEDELALRCSADFADWLMKSDQCSSFYLSDEDVYNWLIRWVCRECGFLDRVPSPEVPDDVTL